MLDGDYSFADRLLHRLALGSRALCELSFDLDQKMARGMPNPADVAGRPHVFVTGLARAGTTILLRAIHEFGEFRSLTYRDMPFPLAPNLWKRVSGPREAAHASRERAHGDRILINVDSPEAIEQVFWRCHTGPKYIGRDGLTPYRVEDDEMALFVRYIAAIIASGEASQWRYLSKNNNNILRLDSLVDHFSNALFLIPFRSPADQATSLWRQHLRFCEMQREKPFVRAYMDWLVHHEFGLGHRPYLIGKPAAGLVPADPDYWLDTWIRVHEWLCRFEDPRCLFVSYELLCDDPQVWESLRARLGLAQRENATAFSRSTVPAGIGFDRGLLLRAEELHGELHRRRART